MSGSEIQDGLTSSREDGTAETATDANGELLAQLHGVDVRTSTWAGDYYCGHTHFLVQRHAHHEHSNVLRDRQGHPLAGFLHVPADARARGVEEGGDDRHVVTRAILSRMLIGLLDEVRARPTPERAVRVLLTGFEAFRGIVDNPTGAFASSVPELSRLLDEVVPGASLERVTRGPSRVQVMADFVVDVLGVSLPVSDEAYGDTRAMLPWALRVFQPHIVIGMGVHGGNYYRVELEPNDAAFVVDSAGARHEDGRAIHERLPTNRSLVRAFLAGHKRLGSAG
jgi:hypothetical protein